jgi:phosphorylcholine metabolism protein LicD
MEWNNYKNVDAGCDKYGAPRLELAIFLRDNIFNKIGKTWFIENGTLLGAWRNNKFIPHDDDFDIGMLIDSKEEIADIYHIINQLLPKKYQARVVNTYSDKIEIFQPSYGSILSLQGPKYKGNDYHYVTVDIQFYLKIKNSTQYQVLYHITPNIKNISENMILPTSHIMLENKIFPRPNLTQEFLEHIYGSLDPLAKYCSLAGKYTLDPGIN